jgi:hypothetical protein
MDVVITPGMCDPLPCEDGCHVSGNWLHDACPWTPGLQVKPILGCSVLVGYFAVVTDPEGVGSVSNVYADVWHPDGLFKYQIELHQVYCEDTLGAVAVWEHVTECHMDIIAFNGYSDYEIWEELHQGDAKLFYGEALISYCQPGGCYYVGVRAHDSFGAWSDYLYNCFWYIPTAAVDVDFDIVDYGTCIISNNKWIPGDTNFQLYDGKPTVRNVGNTPVQLVVWQDDMMFGQTDGNWNVEFDARLGAPSDNDAVTYDPFDTDSIFPGVIIPGILDLCTKEKLDFSIHVKKGYPGYTYEGVMRLFAFIADVPFPIMTPIAFIDNAPLGVEQMIQPNPECCLTCIP